VQWFICRVPRKRGRGVTKGHYDWRGLAYGLDQELSGETGEWKRRDN
jgi:hypothetical protein